jgi:MFS family permease
MTFAAMSKIIAKLGRKTLSLALIFNSMASLASVVNILVSSYFNAYSWWFFSPYLAYGLLFVFIIATAVLNIVPAKLLGKVHLKRILFHHYVYGFLASLIPITLTAVYTPAYALVFLMPSLGLQTTGLQTIIIYSGLIFVYGGFALMIDDIRDVSMRFGKTLDRLKVWAVKSRETIQKVHFVSSLATIYVATLLCAWCLGNVAMMESGSLWYASNVIVAANLLVTGFWGLRAVEAKYWFSKLYSDLSKAQTIMYKQYEI